MTNLEAKEKLYMEWQKLLEYDLDYAGISEAYKMAFKALDQEVCRDAISRQAVLDLAEKGVLVSNGNYKSVCKAINELPPVNPQKSKMDLDELKRRILMEVDGGTDDRMLRYCDVCDRISNSIDKYKEESEE